MNSYVEQLSEVLNVVKYHPSVSIILPFEPQINSKGKVELQFKNALAFVEKQLYQNYTAEKALPVITKLHKLVSEVNYNNYKKSIALFASPFTEKIIYLDFDVMEKIVIDDSFEIRDIVYCKKQLHNYLVLVLCGCKALMYAGDDQSLKRIKTNSANQINACKTDLPEKVGNFSDTSSCKENLTTKFLHKMDIDLGLVLNAYPLPVFVMGPEKLNGHFKNITHNGHRINAYVNGNFIRADEKETIKALQPYLDKWTKVRHRDLLSQADKAMGAGKLAIGIESVWETASHKRGRLLLVEKDYVYLAVKVCDDMIRSPDTNLNNPFYIKDAVDDIIEKVLESGGDIEFVDNGALAQYNQIALIEYY